MNELTETPAEVGTPDFSEDSPDQVEDGSLFLTFLLGTEVFGLPVSSVKEVMEYRHVFKTPGVPSYIRGVINIRGDVLPVIDLSCRFYNRVNHIYDDTGIVIVEVMDGDDVFYIGVMIDAIKEVTKIRQSQIVEVPDIGSKIRSDFIEGIGKKDNVFITLLDIGSILDIIELSNF